MKLLFRKILEYDLKKHELNAYIYACDILSQKINPDSLKKQKFIPTTKVVFHSKLKRAKQCIKKSKNIKLISTKSLNEIPFDPGSRCSEAEYNKLGSIAVRKVFKKLFINDGLMIPRKQIFNDIEEVLIYIKNNYSSEKSVTILSHSFRLKCFEAYLKTDGKIVRFPKLINKFIKNSQKTFSFGKGFNFKFK